MCDSFLEHLKNDSRKKVEKLFNNNFKNNWENCEKTWENFFWNLILILHKKFMKKLKKKFRNDLKKIGKNSDCIAWEVVKKFLNKKCWQIHLVSHYRKNLQFYYPPPFL